MYRYGLIIFIMFCTTATWGQGRGKFNDKKAGRVFVSWGWNRAAYGKSTIHFKGADYNFTLYHLTAHDRPTLPIAYNPYLKFSMLTIPQTNLRVSYFYKDNLAISFGDDHMKYVMDNDQTVTMKGDITRNGNFKGSYNGPKTVTRDFLLFEHTDGLNYLNFELEKYYNWYHSKSDRLIISGFAGGGAGVLFPKTNVTLLDYERNDRFHISGFGISAKAGIMLTFLKNFQLKLENKYGYINMPNVILHKKGIPGRAKQAFIFTEGYGTLGFNLPLAHPHKTKKVELNRSSK
jgi:hypothetical protein